jgi:hypothetical protein
MAFQYSCTTELPADKIDRGTHTWKDVVGLRPQLIIEYDCLAVREMMVRNREKWIKL